MSRIQGDRQAEVDGLITGMIAIPSRSRHLAVAGQRAAFFDKEAGFRAILSRTSVGGV